MSAFRIVNTALRDGVWSGVLTGGSGVPRVEVTHMDRPVADVNVTETGADWRVDVPIPPEAIADGIQTFVVKDNVSGEKLAHFTLIAGEAAGDDLQAEIDLLRAELDMLKKAFRRHCVETS